MTIETLLWKSATVAADSPGQEGIRKLTLGWSTDKRDALRTFSAEAPTLDLSAVRALAAFLLITVWAWWADHHRESIP